MQKYIFLSHRQTNCFILTQNDRKAVSPLIRIPQPSESLHLLHPHDDLGSQEAEGDGHDKQYWTILPTKQLLRYLLKAIVNHIEKDAICSEPTIQLRMLWQLPSIGSDKQSCNTKNLWYNRNEKSQNKEQQCRYPRPAILGIFHPCYYPLVSQYISHGYPKQA